VKWRGGSAEDVDQSLLARIEDASLHASAPPEQRWLDGWLLRFSPGKAKRARSIQAVAPGRLPIDTKLALAAEVYREAALPMLVRVTPLSAPAGLDAHLAALGWEAIEDTLVLVHTGLGKGSAFGVTGPTPAHPPGLCWTELDTAAFAQAVGVLRGSTPTERDAHAERLRAASTRFQAYAWTDATLGTVVACGQFAREGDLVGIYDVFTAAARRRTGLASSLCERMLSISANEGAKVAYLQVGADNLGAQRVYGRLGFAVGYSYHYRVPGRSP